MANHSSLFKAHGLKLTPTGNGSEHVADCPWCGHRQGFCVNAAEGTWVCHRCGVAGNAHTWAGQVVRLEHELLTSEHLQVLAEDRGLPRAAFRVWKDLGVALDGERFTLPLRQPNGKVSDVRFYTPGAGFKSTPGGVLWPWGLAQLNGLGKGEGVVWLCEGEWDAIALRWLLKRARVEVGIVVLGIPGASTFKTPDWLPLFANKDVVVAYDADKAGVAGAAMVGAKLEGVARRVRWVHWPEGAAKGWDVRDFVCDVRTGSKDWQGGWHELLGMLQASPPTRIEVEGQEQGLKGVKRTLGRTANPPEKPEKAGSPGAEEDLPMVLRFTDLGNARRFGQTFSDRLRFHPGLGWHEWDGRRWYMDGSCAQGYAKQILLDQLEALVRAEEGFDVDEIRHIVGSASASKIGAVVELAQSEGAIRMPRERLFDTDPWLLNCPNGTLNLQTGKLRKHRPGDLLSKLAGAEYQAEAKCPRWRKFVLEVFAKDDDLVGYLQRVLGYTLSGDTSEQCFFLLYGTGRNGKSTLLEVVRTVLGDYAVRASFRTFLQKVGDAGSTGDLARLAGARFVSAIEAPVGQRLDEALVKELVGGDKIAARFLYKDYFEYHPVLKLFLAANHLPEIYESTEAMWRRIRQIPFLVRFGEDKCNPHLKEELFAEREGILAWMVEGCQQWQQAGLGRSGMVDKATARYKADQDILADWIRACCVLEPGKRETTRNLFGVYKAWAVACGYSMVSARVFGRKLEEKGVIFAWVEGQRGRNGIRLKPGENAEKWLGKLSRKGDGR